MNKAQLIEAVARNLPSKAAAERAVNAVLDGIQQGLKKNRKVMLVGFGTFGVRQYKARIGRNPRTGKRIKVKKSRSVGFKASQVLRHAL